MYICYNCGYENCNRTKMNIHLTRQHKCKSIRDIYINLNECKEYILNKVSYINYLKIIGNTSITDNIILQLKKVQIYPEAIPELKNEILNSYEKSLVQSLWKKKCP